MYLYLHQAAANIMAEPLRKDVLLLEFANIPLALVQPRTLEQHHEEKQAF